MPNSAAALQTLDYWDKARRALSRADKVMARIIRNYKGERMVGSDDAFETLARSIVGQQISVKAAASIWAAMEKRLKTISPEKIARCRMTSLRACGLSQNKAAYIRNIAAFFRAHGITPRSRYWENIDAAEARAQLLEIKGVGEWTWQMFAIFYLKQPDILPLRDLGLVNAIRGNYADGAPLKPKDLARITEVWQPWRTVATWYLWRSIDPEPVAY